jgi:hypothetical protein
LSSESLQVIGAASSTKLSRRFQRDVGVAEVFFVPGNELGP